MTRCIPFSRRELAEANALIKEINNDPEIRSLLLKKVMGAYSATSTQIISAEEFFSSLLVEHDSIQSKHETLKKLKDANLLGRFNLKISTANTFETFEEIKKIQTEEYTKAIRLTEEEFNVSEKKAMRIFSQAVNQNSTEQKMTLLEKGLFASWLGSHSSIVILISMAKITLKKPFGKTEEHFEKDPKKKQKIA